MASKNNDFKKSNNCTKTDNCSACTQNELCGDWHTFVLNHMDIKPYAHFDKRVSLKMPSVRSYVMNPTNIVRHSFFPFIHYTQKQSKYNGKNKKVKKREIYYCSHLDRCVYQRYSFLINYLYNIITKDLGIYNCAIAYRDKLGENNIDFAKNAFDFISEQKSCVIIVGDFTSFFDNLDHKYLKKMLKKLLNTDELPDDYYAIFKAITRYSSWEWNDLITQNGLINKRGILKEMNDKDTILPKDDFKKYKKSMKIHRDKVGVPQGSPISAVISNVYMLDADKLINDYVNKLSGLYLRYSDDFLVVLPNVHESQTQAHCDWLFEVINNIPGLTLHPEKTELYTYDNKTIINLKTNSSDSLDYLGFVFDGTNIKIRPKAISKYHYRLYKKSNAIGYLDGETKYGNTISYENIYHVYSTSRKPIPNDKKTNKKHSNFIHYIERANKILSLNDPESFALKNNHKAKVRKAINRAKEKYS